MPRVLKYHEAKLKIGRLMQELRLREGDKLPPENELAGRLGMSIGPVRQALGDLRNVGVVRKVPGVGTFLAQTLSDGHSTATVGLVSISDHTNAGRQRLFHFKEAAQRYQASPLVIYAEDSLNPALVEELSRCDRFVVTGRVNPWWMDYLNSQGKPLVLLGESPDGRDYSVPRVRYDWTTAFRTGVEAMKARGLRKFGGILFSTEHFIATTQIMRAFAAEQERAGLTADPARSFLMPPEGKSVETLARFLKNNRDQLEVLFIDCSCIEIFWYVRGMVALPPALEVVVFGEEQAYMYSYAEFPGHHQLCFPESPTAASVKVLFDWSGRFLEECGTYWMQPELQLSLSGGENAWN